MSTNTPTITLYPTINEILFHILKDVTEVLGENLIGLYLFGSLTYGDFNLGSSDIDLVAIINNPLTLHELELLKQLHKRIENHFPIWKERLECSYTPVDMLSSILPPKTPRPYYGGGVFYDEAPYGNEWIINNYLLYQHGIKLIGPNFKNLISPIDFVEVQKACIRDLFQEWEAKITDFEWLSNSHYQSYLVLNLCRIMYTVLCGKMGSKKIAAKWVKDNFPSWSKLIETAEGWEYGEEMKLREEAIDFIKFVIDKIKQTKLYVKMHI